MSVRLRVKAGVLLAVLGTYSFYLAGCAAVTGSGASKGISSSSEPAIPAMPTNLAAAAGNAQVTLTWTSSAGATSYHVKRAATGNGPFTQVASSSVTGCVDSPLTNGTTYFYAVSAVNSAGESPNSSPISAKPTGQTSSPAPTVASVTISPTTASSIPSGTLTFSATVHGTVANTSVTWRASLGTITSSGHYIAPATAGTDTVTATSNADPTKAASASVTIAASAAPPATPPPPNTPPPATTAGLPDGFFSLSVNGILASHFPTVPFGGIRLWDTNTGWSQIETSSGSYSWTHLDTWLRLASSHGKDSMYTFGRVPTWASMRPTEACPYLKTNPGCAAPPSDVDSGDATFKAFVTALVKHSLSAPELHIAYYEMWNEPDLQRNWTGTPAQLVTMAKDAYAIIHSLDPTAKVVGPGASTANQYGVHFLPAYYAAGGATPQDIVGLHAYLYSGTSFSTTPAGITTSITQLQKLMATYQISSKPVFFTEGSWNGEAGGPLTDPQKAAYLAQEYMLMWSTDVVARYYWYAWDSDHGTLWIPSTGLTQAGTAYNQLAGWLIGSTHSANPCSTASDGTWTCTLTLSTDYPAQIIWNPNVSRTITVGPEFATSRTLTNSNVSSIANHQVAIGPLPILIIQSQTQ